MHFLISRSFIKAILFVSALFVMGCSKVVEFNGFYPGSEVLDKLEREKASKSQVRALLGNPPIIHGTNQNLWIYFSQQTEKLAFFQPEVVAREVALLIFSNNGRLKEIEHYTIKDSRIIEISTNKVVSGGRKLTTLQQIFGNIGNFSAQDLQK